LGSQSMSFAQTPGSVLGLESLIDARACSFEVKVSDPSPAPIGGAQVSVAPKHDPQAAQRGTTDGNGVFRDRLIAGHYDLRVESPGFQAYVHQDLNLSCDNQVPVTVDVQLTLGILMGEVIVVDTTPRLVRKAWFRTKSAFRRFLNSI
jgi:Carboxypeptidase regulatory-like domain